MLSAYSNLFVILSYDQCFGELLTSLAIEAPKDPHNFQAPFGTGKVPSKENRKEKPKKTMNFINPS